MTDCKGLTLLFVESVRITYVVWQAGTSRCKGVPAIGKV